MLLTFTYEHVGRAIDLMFVYNMHVGTLVGHAQATWNRHKVVFVYVMLKIKLYAGKIGGSHCHHSSAIAIFSSCY